MRVLRVDGREYDVELSDPVVGQVHAPVSQDVAFFSGQQRVPLEPSVLRPDTGRLFQSPPLV